DDGALSLLPVALITPGMIIAVAMGERIPVDGEVTAGASEIDTSLVTGETLPRPVGPGDVVYAGTINLGAPLRLRATAADDQTLLSEIVRLMEAAQQSRARYVRLADRAARFYAPAAHVLALATFLSWLTIGGLDWQPALLIAISVLIITCPCALGLAVPVVQVVASGRLMKRGILLKSADGLERLAEIDHVVFDKTGTLTHGRAVLINRDSIEDRDLQLAASLAAASTHPLCRALVAAADSISIAEDVREEPGMGLSLKGEHGEIRLGSGGWCHIEDEGPTLGPRLWLSQPDRPAIRFDFSDLARADASETVATLRRRGYGVELVSGDRPEAVAAVAQAVGIDEWRADTRPDGKTDRLAALARQGRKTVMIGDGLNDAPALAAAFASISPSDASDISRTAADVLFQGEALAPVVETLDVARRSRRLMLENFGLALTYNAVAVPLAMMGLVTPLYAAIAMSASSLLVTLNALRLYLDHWRDRGT
ncbi:MAG: cadmium-translocating P-type ATPase, partial [Rhodospirillaceae bacterium]|nr:cadmium-translocating P-type ATPase [Rhodospirillaceae bacterium]